MSNLYGRFCLQIVKPEVWPPIDPLTQASFITVSADGVDADGFVSSTTTQLTLYFNRDIPGLLISDITLTKLTVNMANDGSYISDINKISLSPVNGLSNAYTLCISGIVVSGSIDVTISPSVSGLGIIPNTRRVIVYGAHANDTNRIVLLSYTSGGHLLTVPGPLLVAKKPFPLLGTWQWYDSPYGVWGDDNIYARIKFYELNGVTEVYYNTNTYTGVDNNGNPIIIDGLGPDANAKTSDGILQWTQIKTFISLASKVGIKVFALISSSAINNTFWLDPSRSGFNNFAANYKAYQTAVADNERFSGLHLDFENYEIKNGSNTDITNALQVLVDFFVYAKSNYKSVFGTIDADIDPWIEGYSVTCGALMSATKAILTVVDRVFLMSYSSISGGTYAKADNDGWLNASNNPNNIPVMFGAETQDLTDFTISYYTFGKSAMYTEMATLKTSVADTSRTGLSVHDSDTWMRLITDTSAVPWIMSKNNLFDKVNYVFTNRSLSLSGFTSSGIASQVLAKPDSYCYFNANFIVSDPNYPEADSFEIYVGSGYTGGSFYANGYVQYYDTKGGILTLGSQSWNNGTLPISIVIPNGVTLAFIEDNGFPQSVLDTLIVS